MSEHTQIDDGGQAFPNTQGHYQGESWAAGMSLRDYFAGQALVGMLAAGEASSPCILVDPKLSHSQKRCMTEAEFAACCYSYADAMLAARKPQAR